MGHRVLGKERMDPDPARHRRALFSVDAKNARSPGRLRLEVDGPQRDAGWRPGRTACDPRQPPQAGCLSAHAATRVWQEQPGRSEEHTSELQSLMRISYAVFC